MTKQMLADANEDLVIMSYHRRSYILRLLNDVNREQAALERLESALRYAR